MEKRDLLLAALIKKYEAEIAEAKATLAVYFESSVGIGEHPQIVDEMDALVEKLANAEDKLESVERNFTEAESLNEVV
jgi:methylaspartate ammonia-lyase